MAPRGVIVETVSPQVIEACAAAAHMAIRANRMGRRTGNPETDYDPLLGKTLTWSNEYYKYQEETRKGVSKVLLTDSDASEIHTSWLSERKQAGWTYGPVKEVYLKQHPCMVLYEDLLPEHRKEKEIFVLTVREMAAALSNEGTASADAKPASADARPAVGNVPSDAYEPMLRWFVYEHLPPHLQEVSRPFGELARRIVSTLRPSAERTVSLRKLLESKDAAVRAKIGRAHV